MTQNKQQRLGETAIYDMSKLSIPHQLILGLQHTFAMFGATILVPILTGLEISTTLLMAGLGTFLFHLITKRKVPAFLGSSFAFIAGYHAIAPDKSPLSLAYASGGVICAGFLYLIFSAFIKTYGIKKVMRFFPPVVTGPIIICIGLTLSPVAISSASQNWLLALVAIGTIILANIWGKGMVKIIPILLGIFVSYLLALVLGAVDFPALQFNTLSDFISLPIHTSRMAKFDLSAIITIVPIALATMMEHIGDISAISATTGRNYLSSPGLHRTLLGDGLATMLAAFFGAPANTTYGENTGVLALTRVYDARCTRIAAGFAVILSFFPLLSAVISSIPTAIIGGVSLILYGMISAVGVRNMVENHVDLTKSRNLIVAAAILVTGLGFATQPITFDIFSVHITLSGIAISAITGIVLNAVLPGKDYVFEESEPKVLAENVNFSGTDTTLEGYHAEEHVETK